MDNKNNVSGLENLQTSENWSKFPGGNPYDKVYWIDGNSGPITINNDTFQVSTDRKMLERFQDPLEGAQAVLLKNGKPVQYKEYTSKQYVTLALFPENRAVMAFLPAHSII